MNLRTLKNWKLRVSDFRPDARDIPYVIQGIGISVLFGELFYDSIIAAFVLLPIAFFWVILQKHSARKRRCRQVGIEFRDAIFSVLTSLKAGYSAENAFLEAGRDMALLYGKDSDIVAAFSRIAKGLTNNIPLEKLIMNLGKEAENEDIQDFAHVFAVAKRSGGGMTDIIERTISVISQKINVEKEIDVLISAKRMEARIMDIVPFFIIMYIRITSPGFFDCLYHNFFGILLMSICLAVYVAAFVISERIVDIPAG